MKSAEKESPAFWAGLSFSGWLPASAPGFGGTSRFLFDFPRGVMRDVHRKIVAGTSQCGHCYASKWLTPGDSLVLPGAAGDDMGATIHFRLRLVEVASIKGRENLITIAVGQHAGAVNVFLVADATFSAAQRADILSSIFSPFMFWVVTTASSVVALPSSATSMVINGRKMKCVT